MTAEEKQGEGAMRGPPKPKEPALGRLTPVPEKDVVKVGQNDGELTVKQEQELEDRVSNFFSSVQTMVNKYQEKFDTEEAGKKIEQTDTASVFNIEREGQNGSRMGGSPAMEALDSLKRNIIQTLVRKSDNAAFEEDIAVPSLLTLRFGQTKGAVAMAPKQSGSRDRQTPSKVRGQVESVLGNGCTDVTTPDLGSKNLKQVAPATSYDVKGLPEMEGPNCLLSEESAPLQNVLLQTMEGDHVGCMPLSEDGLFYAEVTTDTTLLQVKPVLHSLFKAVRVYLDEVVISPSDQAVVELGEGENHFSLVVQYHENSESLVADQYIISIFRPPYSPEERKYPEAGLPQQQVTPEVESEGQNVKNYEDQVQMDIANIKRLENQLEELEQHFSENFGIGVESKPIPKPASNPSIGESKQNGGTPSSKNAKDLKRKLVQRQATPNSPLVGTVFDNGESVFSCGSETSSGIHSNQNSVDHPSSTSGQNGGSPQKLVKIEKPSPVAFRFSSPKPPKVGGAPPSTPVKLSSSQQRSQSDHSLNDTPSSKLNDTREKISYIKQSLHANAAKKKMEEDRKMASAMDRICKLEQQLRDESQQHRKDHIALHADVTSQVNKTREDALQRNQAFQTTVEERVVNMQQMVHKFSHDIFARIEEEKELIHDKSKDIECRLCEKLGKLTDVVEGVQAASSASQAKIQSELNGLTGLNIQVNKRLSELERGSSSLNDKFSAMDRRMKYMEHSSEDFKTSVCADISALEELMQNEKKERRFEDGEIISALNMYAESLSEGVSFETAKLC